MINKKNIILTFTLIFFILNAQVVINSTMQASYIYFNKVFSSTFVFIILSDILIYFDYHYFINKICGSFFSKLFKISRNNTIIIILSLLSSHPSNAIYLKDKLDKGEITLEEAERIFTFTLFPSIMFVIGTIGISLFNSFKIGIILLINNYLCNFLLGIFLSRKINFTKNNLHTKTNNKNNFFHELRSSILKTINTAFVILGNLTIFIIIINILNKYIKLPAPILGLLEMTSGIMNTSVANIDFKSKIFFISFLLNFSGISIIFQGASIISEYKFNYKKIILLKLFFSFLSSIGLYIFIN